MKTKLLFWCAVLFLALGISNSDSAIFYFFSIHFFMLFIGVFFHKFTKKLQPDQTTEPLPETAESGND